MSESAGSSQLSQDNLQRPSGNRLLLRIISAVVFAAVFLILPGLFWGAQGLFLMGLIAIAAAVVEYSFLLGKTLQSSRWVPLLFSISLGSLIGLEVTQHNGPFNQVYWGLVFVFYGSVILWSFRQKPIDELFKGLSISALGFLYCGVLPTIALTTLRLPAGMECFYTLLAVVFAGDSFAFFGGKWFGRSKIYPRLSPKKTYAGAAAGLLGSMVAAAVSGTFFLNSLPLWYLVVLAFFMGLAGQSGDLFVSLLKRVAEVKDSGKVMPGHGGVLDRLDGVFFAAPLFYFFIQLGYYLV